MSYKQQKNNNYNNFGDGNLTKITVDDESSSNDDETTNGYKNHDEEMKQKMVDIDVDDEDGNIGGGGGGTIKRSTFEISDNGDNDNMEISYHQQQKASTHGEPRRLIHIWLRVMLIILYLVLTIGAIFVMIDTNDIFIKNKQMMNILIIFTIILPTILFFFILIKPQCMPLTSCVLLIIIILLRMIQWIFAITFYINDDSNFIIYLFAILGASLNECGFLIFVTLDFYIFYVRRDYDNAILSVHYNSQKAVRLISSLLFISSILWSIYCYGALGDETQYIDTWFYLILCIITFFFIIFEYGPCIKPKWSARLGFPFCCIIMLYILFLWGDGELLSFSDIATASILPQLMCLSFAFFKKFAAECM